MGKMLIDYFQIAIRNNEQKVVFQLMIEQQKQYSKTNPLHLTSLHHLYFPIFKFQPISHIFSVLCQPFSSQSNGKTLFALQQYFEKNSQMPQHVRQLQSQSIHSGKRECHSLKYRQIAPNTPFYTIPNIALPAKSKNRKQNDKQSDSFETCQSDGQASSERTPPSQGKIKVELCKNFVEKGYCPYENRCRFAHGIQELRAKDTWGNCELYRTRRCKVFYEKHECKFGERCNFMHQNRKVKEIVANNGRAIREAIRINFQEIGLQVYTSRVHSSKLMGLLRGECGESDSNI